MYLQHIADVMFRMGLPWEWFWDERLEDAGHQLTGPIIVPDAHCLTVEQIEAINQVAKRGEGVLWIGNMPQSAWNGRGPCPLPAPFEMGNFELVIDGAQNILKNICEPVMLNSRAGGTGPAGKIIATIDGEPGLVLMDEGKNRQAWLAGLPIHSYLPCVGYHGAYRIPTGGTELWKQLLNWLAPKSSVVRLESVITDYGRIRPWDVRDVPTIEMFPLVSEDAILAIIFPYERGGFEASLIVNLPEGAEMTSIRELWEDTDMTKQAQQKDNGEIHLPLKVPGSFELLAIRVGFKST